jgi:hypothetical protein
VVIDDVMLEFILVPVLTGKNGVVNQGKLGKPNQN